MKPDYLYEFTEPFASHLKKLLNGWKPPQKVLRSEAKWRSDPISDGQKYKLKNLGVKEFPSTKGAASDLITKLTK